MNECCKLTLTSFLNWTLNFRRRVAAIGWWIIRYVIPLAGPLAVLLFLWLLIWGYLTFGQRRWIRIVNRLLRQLLLGIWLVIVARRRRDFGAFLFTGQARILRINTHAHSQRLGLNENTNQTQYYNTYIVAEFGRLGRLVRTDGFPVFAHRKLRAGDIREDFVRNGDESVSTAIAVWL